MTQRLILMLSCAMLICNVVRARLRMVRFPRPTMLTMMLSLNLQLPQPRPNNHSWTPENQKAPIIGAFLWAPFARQHYLVLGITHPRLSYAQSKWNRSVSTPAPAHRYRWLQSV